MQHDEVRRLGRLRDEQVQGRLSSGADVELADHRETDLEQGRAAQVGLSVRVLLHKTVVLQHGQEPVGSQLGHPEQLGCIRHRDGRSYEELPQEHKRPVNRGDWIPDLRTARRWDVRRGGRLWSSLCHHRLAG